MINLFLLSIKVCDWRSGIRYEHVALSLRNYSVQVFLNRYFPDRIDAFISAKDYNAALTFVNFKQRLTRDKARVIVDKYDSRIIELIKKDSSLQEAIKAKYFSNCPFS